MTKSEMKLTAELLRITNRSPRTLEQRAFLRRAIMESEDSGVIIHNAYSQFGLSYAEPCSPIVVMDYLSIRLDVDADNAPVSIKPFPLFEPLQKNVAVSFINDADQLQQLNETVNRVGMVKNVDSTRDVETGKWNTVLTIGPVE